METDNCSFGSIEYVNLFAYRTHKSKELKKLKNIDIVGPHNNFYILNAAKSSDLLIAAWGNDGKINGRDKEVLNLLKDYTFHCIDITKENKPSYPKAKALKSLLSLDLIEYNWNKHG